MNIKTFKTWKKRGEQKQIKWHWKKCLWCIFKCLVSGGGDEKREFKDDNICRLVFSPAEPWGPVCSPGCWTLWSSRRCCRSQHLQNWAWKFREFRLRNYNWSWVPFDICFETAMLLTRLGRWSCPGRCEPPGCSSQPLCIWEYSSGWKPDRVTIPFRIQIFTSFLSWFSQQSPPSIVPHLCVTLDKNTRQTDRCKCKHEHAVANILTCTNCTSCLRQRTVTLDSRSW